MNVSGDATLLVVYINTKHEQKTTQDLSRVNAIIVKQKERKRLEKENIQSHYCNQRSPFFSGSKKLEKEIKSIDSLFPPTEALTSGSQYSAPLSTKELLLPQKSWFAFSRFSGVSLLIRVLVFLWIDQLCFFLFNGGGFLLPCFLRFIRVSPFSSVAFYGNLAFLY